LRFFPDDAGGHPVAGNGLIDKDGKSVDLGQPLSAEGHIDDVTVDDLFFLNGHVFPFFALPNLDKRS
jgi:hypothetical protein